MEEECKSLTIYHAFIVTQNPYYVQSSEIKYTSKTECYNFKLLIKLFYLKIMYLNIQSWLSS